MPFEWDAAKNAANIARRGEKGRDMARKPNPYGTDEENPEWTSADFARAKPSRELFAERGLRYPGQRGPQKSPTKAQVTLRLDRDLLEHIKATGAGWQTRVNQSLRASMMSKPLTKPSAAPKAARRGGRARSQKA
jgi:uncharacterized protein (DUF4415 family)